MNIIRRVITIRIFAAIDIVRPPSRLAPHLSQVFCVKNVSILVFLSLRVFPFVFLRPHDAVIR